jgi:hypothetical protein
VIEAAGCAGRTHFDQSSILIASDGRKVPLQQQIGRSPRFEWAADVIPEVYDVRDADGGNIREHGLKRAAVAMNIGDRSKFHRPAFLRTPQNNGRLHDRNQQMKRKFLVLKIGSRQLRKIDEIFQMRKQRRVD